MAKGEGNYVSTTASHRDLSWRPFSSTSTSLTCQLPSLESMHILMRLGGGLAVSGWGAGATILRVADNALVHSTTVHCAPVWCCSAHTPLSTPPSTMPCEWCMGVCVLHQQTTFQSSQASNLLSFVAKEPHCVYHAVPWSLNICSTQRPPMDRVEMHSALNRVTRLYPPHTNSSFYGAKLTYVWRCGLITNGMQSGQTTSQGSAFSFPTPAPVPRNDPSNESLSPA